MGSAEASNNSRMCVTMATKWTYVLTGLNIVACTLCGQSQKSILYGVRMGWNQNLRFTLCRSGRVSGGVTNANETLTYPS